MNVIMLIAFLSGVLIFIAAMMVFNGKLSAIKRKKTKLGLVKVAGAGLKLGEGEADDSEQPAAAEGVGPSADDSAAVADAVGAGEGTDAGIDAAVGVADGRSAVGAPPDDPAAFGLNAEYEETLAVPLEMIDADDDAEAGVQAPEPEPPYKQSEPQAKPFGADKRDGGVAAPGARKAGIGGGVMGGSVVRPIDKTVDRPSENPFISGKLPLNKDPSAKKGSAPVKRRRLPETVKMKDRKVILAEDVAINRELIAMYFDGSGVKFEFAVNGREVCEKFERDPGAYSLILMDIQMPEMDGYEVSRRIRAMDVDWAKQIPIIAMTGNDQKEDIDLCFDAGMDDHIAKPIDMEILQEKVFDILTLSTESF